MPDHPSSSLEPSYQPPSLGLVAVRVLLELLLVLLATFLLLIVINLSVVAIIPVVVLSPLVFLAVALSVPMGGIYRHALTRTYLKRKLTPLFAAAAVALCTAMVIVVISVMGGFLDMMRSAAQKLTGQVTIRADITGFAHYQDLIQRLEALPEVEAATPVIRTLGLLKLDNRIYTVELMGIEPRGFDAVTGYADTLYWDGKELLEAFEPMERDLQAALRETQDRLQQTPADSQAHQLLVQQQEALEERLAMLKQRQDFYRQRTLRELAMDFEPLPHVPEFEPIVLGIEVSDWNARDEEGRYRFEQSTFSRELTLTVMPISKGGSLEAHGPEREQMVVVNEFKSGLYDVDAKRAYVPFDLLQRMLKMDRVEYAPIDPETGEELDEWHVEPPRASEIMVRGTPGVTLEQLQAMAREVNEAFLQAHPDVPFTVVETWEQRHQQLLSAVEKEKGLLTILFAFISVVAVVLVAVIFYMIVANKTRDIGILRALGASPMGIASIFLGYGLATGIIGAALGVGLAAGIVLNLNEIQDVLYAAFGFKMWDPRIYYFERIPTQLDALEVTVIAIAAVLSSLVGAVVPALLAGRLNPVEALRYE